jgi:hypothetical protein
VDREGHWTREFPSRSIIWPLMEHWAAENGYHLVALRSNRRLYQLGEEGGSFVTYFEIRQDGTRVRIKAWTKASFRSRLLRAFFLPSDVPVSPKGWVGLRYRRFVCRGLNSFLLRCGQPPILHSTNFHLADLDGTTLILGSSLLWSGWLLAYRAALAVRLPRFPLKIETLDAIVTPLAIPVAGVAGFAFVVIALHHFIAVRRFGQLAVRWGSLAAGLMLVLAATLGVSRVTGPLVMVRRVSTECFPAYDPARCTTLMDALTPEQRSAFAARLRTLHNELVRR